MHRNLRSDQTIPSFASVETMANRLFLAVRPPRQASDLLAGYVEPRREATSGLRWVHPEHWHVTLAFLGAVDDDRGESLGENLDQVAAATPGFDLVLGGAGCFPHPAAARVLWTGVRGGGEQLEQLARRCRTAAVRVGIAVDGGRFRGHLTLARSNRGIPARQWLDVIDSFPELRWRVAEFVQVSSELTRGGPRHRIDRRFTLPEE